MPFRVPQGFSDLLQGPGAGRRAGRGDRGNVRSHRRPIRRDRGDQSSFIPAARFKRVRHVWVKPGTNVFLKVTSIPGLVYFLHFTFSHFMLLSKSTSKLGGAQPYSIKNTFTLEQLQPVQRLYVVRDKRCDTTCKSKVCKSPF